MISPTAASRCESKGGGGAARPGSRGRTTAAVFPGGAWQKLWQLGVLTEVEDVLGAAGRPPERGLAAAESSTALHRVPKLARAIPSTAGLRLRDGLGCLAEC